MVISLLMLSLAPPALAHGGFQESEDVVESSVAGQSASVVTNFGVLHETEPGTWAWTCEEVTGVAAPFTFEESGTGTWMIASLNGLVAAADQCDWQPVEGGPGELYATYVVNDTVDPNGVWATTASSSADNALWRSADGGLTWEAAWTPGEDATLRGVLQGEDGLPLWVLGAADGLPTAWYSADGEAWTPHELEDYVAGQVTALAMDPRDDESAWLRFNGSGEDALLHLTADGSLSEAFRYEDQLLGFHAFEDGEHLLVGGRDLGLYESFDAGATWSDRIESPEIGCLHGDGEWLYACGHNWADGGSVLRTPYVDDSATTYTWEPWFWFGDVRGVTECPEGTTTHERCEPIWETVAPSAGYDQDRDEPDTADTGLPDDSGTRCGCSGSEAVVVGLLPMLLGLRRRR